MQAGALDPTIHERILYHTPSLTLPFSPTVSSYLHPFASFSNTPAQKRLYISYIPPFLLVFYLAELVLGVDEDQPPLPRHLLAVGEQLLGVLAAELL